MEPNNALRLVWLFWRFVLSLVVASALCLGVLALLSRVHYYGCTRQYRSLSLMYEQKEQKKRAQQTAEQDELRERLRALEHERDRLRAYVKKSRG